MIDIKSDPDQETDEVMWPINPAINEAFAKEAKALSDRYHAGLLGRSNGRGTPPRIRTDGGVSVNGQIQDEKDLDVSKAHEATTSGPSPPKLR